ncbi:hypothetical protein BDP27DRAFT_1382014 [Rhodocollybia butyracea]|uniref:Diphthamide biosynthesis protein 3 n=1 Tax=Rhodocollybia butyracea TaxID=206335 RepID=A0A9P5PUM4_9AGAR|nr:hypothetical protein BDP27DRAFT_1382014 [Rhodocollybia butyracea]
MLSDSSSIDFYEILALARTASAVDVKAAYHRALITHHPDKNTSKPSTVHIATIKKAYEYDVQLQQKIANISSRPAQVISLEDFEEDPVDDTAWTYPCRCGAVYRITESDMEIGSHIIGCSGCSELVWVGFELATED